MTARWSSQWAECDRGLQARSPSGPTDAMDQDTYWDSGQVPDGMEAPDVPWLDQSIHREREL